MNNEIGNLINGLHGCQGLTGMKDKIEKQDFSKEMINVNRLYNKIINNTEYLKCLLVLNLKKVSWKSELIDKYDISKSVCYYFIQYMKSNGFIITKQFVELDDILYETILRTNPKTLYRQINNTNLITLTPDGESFSKKIVEDCVKLISDRGDILFTINEINNKTLAFRSVYKNLIELESNYGSRFIEFPDGTLIDKETDKTRKFKLELEKALLEHKKELLLEKQENQKLTNQESKELVLINSQSKDIILFNNEIEYYKKTKKPKITYNGIYSHLTQQELEKKVNYDSFNLTKQEEKEIDQSSYKGQVNEEQFKIDSENALKLKLKGYHSEYEEEIKNVKNNAEDFLNSLVGV